MSRTLLLVLGLAAAGALGGGMAALLTHDDAAPPVAGSEKALARLESEVRDAAARIARLEEDVRTLRLAPPMAASALPPAGAPDGAAAPGAASAQPLPTPEDKLDEKVAEAVKKSRTAEMETMGKRFETMARQREGAMLDRFAESSGISPYQREELGKILEARRQAIGDFFRSMFGGDSEVDPAAIREKLTEVTKQSDEQIRALLSADQYDAFKKEDQAARRGPWFMGGGGGPGPAEDR